MSDTGSRTPARSFARSRFTLLLAFCVLAPHAVAQDVIPTPENTRTRPAPRQIPPPEFAVQVRLSGSYTDNFLQAPDGGESAQLVASSVESRFSMRMNEPRLNIYAQINRTFSWLLVPSAQCPATGGSMVCVFDGFEPDMSTAYGVDLRVAGFNVEGRYGKQSRSPRLYGGDQADFATIEYWDGGAGFTFPGNVQVNVLAHSHNIFLQTQTLRSHHTGTGGSLRYRGFGYRFTPEIGSLQSTWETASPNSNYDERNSWASIRAIPVAPLYMQVRYKLGRRSYSIADPGASNFGREDRRNQWTLSSDLRLSERVSWGVYYTLEDAISSRTERSFTSSFLSSGISYRIW